MLNAKKSKKRQKKFVDIKKSITFAKKCPGGGIGRRAGLKHQ